MKYLLIILILIATLGCDDNSNQPIAPGFDAPIVNELDIYLEDGTASGKLKFGPILVPILEDYDNRIILYPSIATKDVTITLSDENDAQFLIYIVRANQNSELNNLLFLGSNLSLITNNRAVFVLDNLSSNNFSLNTNYMEEGLYVVYFKNMSDGKIISEAAFFKTNEANKERIYKRLKIGEYR